MKRRRNACRISMRLGQEVTAAGMKGKLVVISGFSGAGKGTVIGKMMKAHTGYALSVSMTTRQPREYEKDGVEYHFVTNEAFEKLIAENGFLEYAGYVDSYYGAPRAFVEENREAGRDVLLEIEVQGAMQIREQFPEADLIFVAPPDAKELWNRLSGRATETSAKAMKRLRRAVDEVDSIPEYPWLLINDDIDACAESLHAVINRNEASDQPVRGTAGGEIITDPVQKAAFAKRFGEELRELVRDSL